MSTPVVGHDDYDAAVGKRVFVTMWDKKIRQVEVARALQLQQSAVSKKLRGTTPWTVGQLAAVAKLLGTSVAYLAGETDNQDPNGPDPGGTAITDEYLCSVTQITPYRQRGTRFRSILRNPLRKVSNQDQQLTG